jgi:ribosomal protein S18 acetylase RimI-like enzyme
MALTFLPDLPEALLSAGLKLRPRDVSDSDFLRDVYVAYRMDEMRAAHWPLDQILPFLHDQYRLQKHHYDMHYQGAAFGVVELGGERAGRLYLLNMGAELRLIDIAFLPAFRGRGLGGQLIQLVQAQARALGLAKVSLNVAMTNPAISLYLRLGFNTIRADGVYQLMEWPISATTTGA